MRRNHPQASSSIAPVLLTSHSNQRQVRRVDSVNVALNVLSRLIISNDDRDRWPPRLSKIRRDRTLACNWLRIRNLTQHVHCYQHGLASVRRESMLVSPSTHALLPTDTFYPRQFAVS